MKKALIAAVLTLTTTGALADDDRKSFIGVTTADLDGFQVGGIDAGYEINKHFTVGYRGYFASDEICMYGVCAELSSMHVPYVKGLLPLGASAFSAYALGGYAWGEVEASGYGVYETASNDEAAYGVGIEYNAQAFKLYAEYVDIGGDGLSVGAAIRF